MRISFQYEWIHFILNRNDDNNIFEGWRKGWWEIDENWEEKRRERERNVRLNEKILDENETSLAFHPVMMMANDEFDSVKRYLAKPVIGKHHQHH